VKILFISQFYKIKLDLKSNFNMILSPGSSPGD